MKTISKYLLVVSLIIGISSCEKGFEELNQNPFFPTETDIGPLFNKTIESLKLGWNEQFYMHNEYLYGKTQLAALTAETFQNVDIGTEEMWTNYYSTLAIIRDIERRLTELELEQDPETLNNVKAQLKILLAYKTFRLTDLFGDIPFFDAGKGFEGLDYIEPKFDSQEDIYKSLLNDLKWAAENINTLSSPETEAGDPFISFGSFDNLFFGDMLRWQKFANSLRLRHGLRMVEKDLEFANAIFQEILENDLPIISDGEDVIMRPSEQSWEREGSHWSFREHNKLRMGSNIWNQFSENDEANGSGIFDPRAKIFFETNNLNEWAPYPQVDNQNATASGGTPYAGTRDINHALKGTNNIYSPFNYYLIRDEDYIPEIIMTAAEIHFIKAEIYYRGLGVASDVGTTDLEYTLGIVASIDFWQNVSHNSEIWTNSEPLLTIGDLFAISNHPRLLILDNPNKLELIYSQRWIDAFRQPWEAYSLERRTGQTPREGEALQQLRFKYPPSESINNPNEWMNQVGRMGGDEENVKVWWDDY